MPSTRIETAAFGLAPADLKVVHDLPRQNWGLRGQATDIEPGFSIEV